MNLKLLEDVLALIEEGSFTKAAQRRNITQPAFSRRIQTMEEWLGYKCVDRSGSTVTITEAALASEARIRSLITQMHELKNHISSEKLHTKRVIFTASHTISIYFFSKIMRLLDTPDKEHFSDPVQYTFSLKSAYKEDCLAIFLRGDADFFLCNEEAGETSIPSSFQCDSTILGNDRLVPVIGRQWQNQLGSGGLKSDNVPLIMYPDTSYLWKLITKSSLPAMQDRHNVTVACETPLSAGVKEMALEGLGIGWLPKSFAAKEIESGDLINLQSIYGSCDLDLVMYISDAAMNSGLETIFNRFKSMDTGVF